MRAGAGAPGPVIDGERDVSDIQKIVDKLATEIPGARKQVVAGAGHLVPMENPEVFNRMATEFLDALPREAKTKDGR